MLPEAPPPFWPGPRTQGAGRGTPPARSCSVPSLPVLCSTSATRVGRPAPMTTLAAGEVSHRWPQFLPDGRTLLYFAQARANGRERLLVLGYEPGGRDGVLSQLRSASRRYAADR